MGILYRYELKKIMSQKVIWIALLIMTAMIVAQGMSGLMTGNNKLLKKSRCYFRTCGESGTDNRIAGRQSAGRLSGDEKFMDAVYP